MSKKIIDSHSSQLNNKRIQELLLEADRRALSAGSSLNFKAISGYFDSLEQIYINVKDVFVNQIVHTEINQTRNDFLKALLKTEINPEYQTIKMLNYLLRLTRKFNSQIITALQSDLQYFFRTGSRDTKGLLNIPFFEVEDEPELEE